MKKDQSWSEFTKIYNVIALNVRKVGQLKLNLDHTDSVLEPIAATTSERDSKIRRKHAYKNVVYVVRQTLFHFLCYIW